MFFVLLRMFIAIFDGHFNEMKTHESDEDRKGLADTILSILRNEYMIEKYEKKKLEMKEHQQLIKKSQTVAQETPQVAYWFTRIYNQILLYYQKAKEQLYGVLFQREETLQTLETQQSEQQREELLAAEEKMNQNEIKLELSFEIIGQNIRLAQDQEIQIYTQAEQKTSVVNQIKVLSGRDVLKTSFKTSSVTTWINALELAVREVTSNQVSFQNYFKPSIITSEEWIHSFKPYELEAWKDRFAHFLAHNSSEENMPNFYSPYQFKTSGTFIMKACLNQIAQNINRKDPVNKDSKQKNYEKLTIFLDFYFYYYLNIVLTKATEKPENVFSLKQEQQQQVQNNMDVSLLNISSHIKEWMLQLEEEDKALLNQSKTVFNQEINLRLDSEQSNDAPILVRNARPNFQAQNDRLVQSNLKNLNEPQKDQSKEEKELVFLQMNVYVMNASQMIQVFSRISGLYTLWNSLNLQEKINLWFGTGLDGKPYLQIYHKLTFWNQAGWDRRTFLKIPHLKEQLKQTKDFNEDAFQIYKDNYKFPEKMFKFFWKELQTISKSSNQEEESQGFKTMMLNFSAAQIRFVECKKIPQYAKSYCQGSETQLFEETRESKDSK